MLQYRTLFWLFTILVALGQLQRVELVSQGLPLTLYIHELFMVGWLIALRHQMTSWVVVPTRSFLKKHQVVGWLMGWVGAGMVISTLLVPAVTPWLYLARLFQYVIFALTLPHVFAKPIEKVDLRERYIVAGVAVALAGFAQYLFLPDTRFLRAHGWDDHYYRLISTMLDPSFTGMVLVLTWVYTQSIDWLYKHRLLHVLLSVGLAVAIGLTFSRASYLAFALSMLAGFVLHQTGARAKQLLAVASCSALLAVAAVVVAPKPTGEGVDLARTSTIAARLGVNQLAISQFTAKTLLLGDGLFFAKPTPAAQDHARVPDNLFVMLIQAIGLPGFAMVGWLSWRLWQWLLKNDRWMGTAFLAVLIHSQFNNTLLEPFVLLCMLGGLASIGQSSTIAKE